MSGKKPPLIFVGGLSNRIWCATRYTKNADGMFTAHEKFDVTDQVGSVLDELDLRGLELRPQPQDSKVERRDDVCPDCGQSIGHEPGCRA